MRRAAVLIAYAISLCACAPTFHWQPRKAEFTQLKRVAGRVIRIYEGDIEELTKCPHTYLGDVVCDPTCRSGQQGFGVEDWARARGATHVLRVEAKSTRVGTEVTATTVHGPYGISTGRASSHDVYASWERFRLFRVSPSDQNCFSEPLRYDPID